MHEISVSIVSPEAADHGVAELWAAGELIGYTLLEDSDWMLRIEPGPGQTAVVIGARSLAQALNRAEHLLEHYRSADAAESTRANLPTTQANDDAKKNHGGRIPASILDRIGADDAT
jgi:hypothetical protein